MTTTRRRRPPLFTRSLRPHLLALLALAYVVAWWSFGERRVQIRLAPRAELAGPRSPVVWYSELPPGERPPVALPDGWMIAPTAQRQMAPPRPVRASAAHPGRIRTRSS
jgi:hypothetical protein